MQYLSLALYAEGSTDYYFLRALLQRLCEDICVREAREPVDVSEVLALDHPKNKDGESGMSEFLCKRFGLQLTEMRSPN